MCPWNLERDTQEHLGEGPSGYRLALPSPPTSHRVRDPDVPSALDEEEVPRQDVPPVVEEAEDLRVFFFFPSRRLESL